MMYVDKGTANKVWAHAIDQLMVAGDTVPSRLSDTKELSPVMLQVHNPRAPLVTAYCRPVNPAFSLAEVLWILDGRNDVVTLKEYNSRIGDYSDDGKTFNAAYGHRIRKLRGDYLEDLIATLRVDQGSRQAVLQIWDSTYDLPFVGKDYYTAQSWEGDRALDQAASPHPNTTKDRACNVVGHALIRDGRLNWTQFMRSNDAIWGTPNNFMQWMHIMQYVAARVGVELGSYNHVADSFHCYDYHWDEARVIRHFDLYKEFGMEAGHAPMNISDEAIAGVTEWMDQMRNADDPSTIGSESKEVLGQYWYAVCGVFAAWRHYKLHMDSEALNLLIYGVSDPVLAAAQLRYFWWFRWGQDETMASTVREALRRDTSWNSTVRRWITCDTKDENPSKLVKSGNVSS